MYNLMITAVNISSPTVAKVTRKPGRRRPAVISCLLWGFYGCADGDGRVLPTGSAVLEGEEVSECGIRLGVVMVVAAVLNSFWIWTLSSGWSVETALPDVGDAFALVCFTSLQTTSEVFVPVILTPNLHLQGKKGNIDVGNTGHGAVLF